MGEVDYSLQSGFNAKLSIKNADRREAESKAQVFEKVLSVAMHRRFLDFPQDLNKLTEGLFELFNEAKSGILDDFISSKDFHNLAKDFMTEMIWSFKQSNLPERKMQEYTDDFCEYFEKFIFEPDLPEIQSSGIVLARLLEKIIFEVIGSEIHLDFQSFQADLKELARLDGKSLFSFLETYQNCFEAILKNFNEQAGGEELIIAHDIQQKAIKTCFFLEKTSYSKLKNSRVRLFTHCIERIFAQFKNHGLKLNISIPK